MGAGLLILLNETTTAFSEDRINFNWFAKTLSYGVAISGLNSHYGGIYSPFD